MAHSDKPLNPNDPYNRHGTRHETPEKNSTGKAVGIAVAALAVAAVAAAGIYFVDLDQTQEARLPNVDVKVTEGQLPKFDVEVADVSVGTKSVDVEVPTMNVQTETRTIEVEVPVDVDAGTETETVEVPTINIERPKTDNPANNPTD